MSIVVVEAQKREPKGSRAARQLRREGQVPGVLYSSGKNAVHLLFDNKKLTTFLHRAHGLIDLRIADEKAARKCILKEVQYDPVTDNVLHVDFLGVKMSEKLQVAVPILLKGSAEGVKEGGRLEQMMREVNIECLPKDLPEYLELDVSHLKIGKSVQVKELAVENFVILSDENDTIAVVEAPKGSSQDEEDEEAAAMEESGVVEPEVVGGKGKDSE